jgi:hypothetical protein
MDRLFPPGTYPPEMLKRMGQALDGAWAVISPSITPAAIEEVRMQLADIIFSLVSNGFGDASADELKDHALRVFKRADRK